MRLLQTVGFFDSLPPDTVVGPSRSSKHCTGITDAKCNRMTKAVYYEYTNTATSDKLRLAVALSLTCADARLRSFVLIGGSEILRMTDLRDGR